MKRITAKVLRSVEIDITELTENDLELIDKEQLLVITLGLIELLKHQRDTKVRPEEKVVLKTAPTPPNRTEPAVAIPTIKKEALIAVAEHKKGHEGNIGFKYGTTSKFHYVSYNRHVKVNPWCTSIKIDGKNNTGYFKSEMEAAIAVDEQLDFLQDEKRPRNYNKFPEVMEYRNNRAQKKK